MAKISIAEVMGESQAQEGQGGVNEPLTEEERRERDALFADKESVLGRIPLDKTDLSPAQLERLKDLLYRWRAVFSEKDVLPPAARSSDGDAIIDTGDSRPICVPRRPEHPDQRAVVIQEIAKLLKAGIIRRSKSPWSSALCIVRKPNGGWRVAVDYVKLNNVTKKDVYPMPRIQECLDVLGEGRMFSSMDATSGFHQIPIEEESREKTAFSCSQGLFEFNRAWRTRPPYSIGT